MRRLLLGVCVAALGVAVFVGTGSAAGGRTWVVTVGGESADHAVQFLDYYPRTITIDVGDSITFTLGASEHTVTFLSGANPPRGLAVPQKDGRLQFPSDVAYPRGGPTYDGSGYVNSGMLNPSYSSWTVTFTKAGTFTYQCLLHRVQTGTVVVQPAGTPYPQTDAQMPRASTSVKAQQLAAGARLRSQTRATVSQGANGTVYTQPMVGDPAMRIALYRFGTDTLTVKVGDTVRWVMQDPDEIHTVTFAGAGQIPDFIVPSGSSQMPPLYYNPKAVAPAGGPTHAKNTFYNSGIIFPVNPPGPTEYSLRFTQPGTFTYWCVVHVPEGMRGTVVVTR